MTLDIESKRLRLSRLEPPVSSAILARTSRRLESRAIGAGAGGRAESLLLGEGDDLPLLAEGEGADYGHGIFRVAKDGQHARYLALVEHVHHESLDDIVEMVPEGDLVEALGHRVADELGAPLGRAPIAVHAASGLEPAR